MQTTIRRRAFILFWAISVLASVLLGSIPVQAANSNVALDDKRRLIRAAIVCAEKTDVIDTDDDTDSSITGWDGLWDDIVRDGDSGKRQKIVVGFELDSDNGVASCHTLMPRGVAAAGIRLHGVTASNASNARELLARHYTTIEGGNFIPGQTYDVINGGNDRSEALRDLLQPKVDEIEAPNTQLRVRRFVGLVKECFRGVKDENPSEFNEGNGDFKVAGVGTFLQRGDLGNGNFKWINEASGPSTTAFIGDVELGYALNGTTSAFKQDNSNSSSDFYPIGNDISPPRGEGYTADDSIVDCHFVKKFKDLIFSEPERWSFSGDSVPLYRAPAGQEVVAAPGNETAPDADAARCESSGFSLAWIFCPLINGLAEASDAIFNSIIRPLLVTDIDITTTGPIFGVWADFRTFANILLVLFLLVAVFGQTIGGGIIDAYTAKKIIPRVVITAVLINLSIYIVALALDVTNVIGQGIHGLISLPFEGQSANQITISGGVSGLGIAAVVGAGAAVWAIGTAVIPFILLFVLLPLLMAFLGIMATLLIRVGLIYFLIFISPVAFALYCLPNTEKYFQQWWSLLFKALLVYPIVMAVFAMSNVMAAIMTNGATFSGAADGIGDIAGIILFLMPLFLIPFAFKLSGGAIGSLYGSLSGLGKKATEAIKGNPNDQDSLRNKYKRNVNVARTAAGITPGMVGAYMNPANYRNKRTGLKADVSAQRQRGFEVLRKQIEGTPQWQAAQGDSNVTKLLAHHASAKDAEDWINNTYASDPDKRTKMYGALATAKQIGFNNATRRAALMNPYQVKFEMPSGEEGWNQAIGSIASIAGGRIEDGQFVGGDQFQFRSMMDEYQAVAKGAAGRADQAGNVDGKTAYDLDKATGSQSLYTLLNGHPNGVNGLMDEHLKRIKNPAASKEERELSATFLREMSTASTKNQGTAGVRDEINKRQADMKSALDTYVSSEVAGMGGVLPTTRKQQQTVTVTDPGTGDQVATTQVADIDISGDIAARQAEAARQVISRLDGLGRGYTPMDPNNMETD